MFCKQLNFHEIRQNNQCVLIQLEIGHIFTLETDGKASKIDYEKLLTKGKK